MNEQYMIYLCIILLFSIKIYGIDISTRGIWKVLSMVFYLSNRFTNPFMLGIILKSFLYSMLWHIFHEDIIMLT